MSDILYKAISPQELIIKKHQENATMLVSKMQFNAFLLLAFLPAILAAPADLKAQVTSEVDKCPAMYEHVKSKMMAHPLDLLSEVRFAWNLNKFIHEYFDQFMGTYYQQIKGLKENFEAPEAFVVAVIDQIDYETLKNHEKMVRVGIAKRKLGSSKPKLHLFGDNKIKKNDMTEDLQVEMINMCTKALVDIEHKIHNLITELQRIAKEIAKERFIAIGESFGAFMKELVEIDKKMMEAVKTELPEYYAAVAKKRKEAKDWPLEKTSTRATIQQFYEHLEKEVIAMHRAILHIAHLDVHIAPIPVPTGPLVARDVSADHAPGLVPEHLDSSVVLGISEKPPSAP